jgi:hypothetical protein
MSFTASVPTVVFVPAGTSHADEGVKAADHAYAYELK